MGAPQQGQGLDGILREVATWEPPMRIHLARQILQTLEEPDVSEPPKRMSPDQVFGLLKTEAPAPSDKECRKIIEEEALDRLATKERSG